MNSNSLDYDHIASDYDQRYPPSQQWERGRALLNLARQLKAGSILETGSGTGFWLTLLSQVTPRVFGLDFSLGMLKQARNRPAPLKLSRGTALRLPYQNESFDLVYCVDAIHHFGDQRAFIAEAFRVLKPNGALAVIGNDPHESDATNWYVYDYFDGVYDTDLRRFPSGAVVMKWMKDEGFQKVSSRVVEHIHNVHVGEGVFKDPFIKRNATSQLALLEEAAYQAGLKKITDALTQARAKDERIVFRSEIFVKMLLCYKP